MADLATSSPPVPANPIAAVASAVQSAVASAVAPAAPENINKELLLAAHRGELDKLKQLLDAGADVNYRNEDSMTPLMFAVTSDHLDIVNELIRRGADITTAAMNGATALHLAANFGHVDILKKIIDTHLAERDHLNAQDSRGQTALHGAAEGGMVNSVMLLLQKGADATIMDDDGNTAYDLAQSPEIRGLLPAPRGLPAYASDPVPQPLAAPGQASPLPPANPEQDRKLELAVMRGDIEGVRAALAAGADVNITEVNSNKNTPLHHAVVSHVDFRQKMYPIVDLLLEKGANVNAQRSDDGHTPFTLSFHDPKFFYALFQKRPDLTLKIKEPPRNREETPLQYATRRFAGRPEKRYLANVIAKAELGEWDGAIAIAREEALDSPAPAVSGPRSGEQRLQGREDLFIPPITLTWGYATGESDGDAMDAIDVKEVYVAKLGRNLTLDQFFRKYMGDGAVFKVGPKFYGIPRKDLLKEYLEGSAIVYECTKTFAMNGPIRGTFEYSDIYAEPYYALRTPAGVLYVSLWLIKLILGTTHAFFKLDDKPEKKLENIASRSSVLAGGPVSSQLHCQAGSDGNVYTIRFFKLPEIEEEEESDEEEELNVVFVKKGEDKTEFPLDLSQTVLRLKEAVKEKLGIAVESQKMVFQGKVLKDDQTLGEANIKKGYTIQLQVSGGRKFTRKQCKKTACKKMGFTQKASCRPYKNCYRHSAGVQKKRRTHKRHGRK
jgi:ankyrin repeat protein